MEKEDLLKGLRFLRSAVAAASHDEEIVARFAQAPARPIREAEEDE